ncbi:ribonucleotide reductase [Armillaria gallica]|uniref:Ribonucleotide reductase n=1 Tax=Armillaria gallica TaxID=47427 RepID=A0A2H3CTT2_ARMGA|nr:ribonucleotide reductase [Armillaria gallica]
MPKSDIIGPREPLVQSSPSQRALDIDPSSNTDPLLAISDERLIIFPLKDSDIHSIPLRYFMLLILMQVWAFYKQQEASFSTAEEVDLSRDAHDWDTKLIDSERSFFSMILVFFALADSIVTENLLKQFSSEIQLPKARFFYGFQAAMENIHSEVYSSLIKTVINDSLEHNHLLHGIAEFPSVAAKAKWVLKWIKSSVPFLQCLVAFTAIEGIFFSRSFAAICWIKKCRILPGLCFSNKLICCNEGLHTEFACLLYNKLKSQLSPCNIMSILTKACDIEKAFWANIMPSTMILVTLDIGKVYNATNPFPFMEMISLKGKTNCFESVGQQRANFKEM